MYYFKKRFKRFVLIIWIQAYYTQEKLYPLFVKRLKRRRHRRTLFKYIRKLNKIKYMKRKIYKKLLQHKKQIRTIQGSKNKANHKHKA